MARAYALALEHGVPGEVYNIGSGQARSIRELLDVLLEKAASPVRVEYDPARSRPSDTPIAVCDATKFKRQTGWEPTIRFEQTVQDTLDYWRAKVAATAARRSAASPQGT
jgi:GDP-4-dehydro-6-deoxy-D-mannose reductase